MGTSTKKITWDSTPIQVESAIRDGDGNVIKNTYQPLNTNLTSIGALSNSSTGYIKLTNGVASLDNNVVDLTSNQSVSGTKSFVVRPRLISTRLPSAYQEVEYLGFDGETSYVDTNIIINKADNLSVEFKANLREFSSNKFITFFGYMTTGTYPRCAVNIYQGKYMLGINATTSSASSPTTGIHNYKFYTNSGLQILNVDGTPLVSTSYSSDALNGALLTTFIGARNNGGTATNFADINVYEFKILHNQTSYYLVPCYRKSDNKAGFYDIAKNTFLPATGTVTCGNNVTDSDFIIANDLALVATTGNYNDLSNKPTVPTATSDLTNDSGFITSSDIPQEIFVCTYGTTTYAEVTQALNDGLFPVCKYNGLIYYLNYATSSESYVFEAIRSSTKTIYRIALTTSDSWSTNSLSLESSSNKVTSLSSSSTDTQYPSAKAVYDNLQLKQDFLVFNTAYDSSTNKVATMSDIPTNSTYVDLTTEQTIAGTKTFSSNPVLNNGVYLKTKDNTNTVVNLLGMSSGNAITIGPSTAGNKRLYTSLETHFTNGGSPTDYAYGYGVGIFGKAMMVNTIYVPHFKYRTSAMSTAGKGATTWNLPYLDSGQTYTLATLGDIPTIPTNISTFTNDSGYITSSSLPTKVSDLNNDSGYITSSSLPTKVSDLTNDSAFITASQVPSEIFYCTYGTTTYAQITQALNDGKLPICVYNGNKYVLFGSTASYHSFSYAYLQYTYYVRVNPSDVWGSGGVINEQTLNKVTSISSSSTNTQYPSAKCVYDNIQNVREVAEGKTNTYVCSYITNEVLYSNNDQIVVESALTDINDNTIALTDLKVGDNIYVTQTNVPDRWVSSIATESETNIVAAVILNKLETAKVPVNDVQVNGSTVVSNNVASITVPTNISDLTNDSSFITLGDVPQEIYWATYGTTTYAQITSALSNGKLVLCKYNDNIYWYANQNSSGYYSFAYIFATTVYRIYITSANVWSNTIYSLENRDNKVTSISSSSTDTQYPSAKLLYDQLALKQDNLTFNTAYDSSTNKVATMSDIPDNTDYVDLTSAQTITGTKKFGTYSTNANVVVKYGALVLDNVAGSISNTTSSIQFNNGSTNYHSIKANQTGIIFSASGNNYGFYSSGFTPTASNSLDLGRSNAGSGRWNNIHMAGSIKKYNGDTGYTLTLPNKTGTVALTSDLPTKVSDLTNDSGFITSVNNVSPDNNGNVTLTIPTQASDVGALASSTKYGASLDLSINSSTYVLTAQLKDQDGNNLGSAQTIDLPLESVVVNGSYNDNTKKIVLTLQSGSTVDFSVADLVSGLQSEITSSNKLSSDLVDDTNKTHKFVTSSEKSTWNGKQDALVFNTTYNASTNKVATMADMPDSTDFVDLTSNQDIAGTKKFNTTPKVFGGYQAQSKNILKHNFSQMFTNTGGSGSTYAYFKLPDDTKDYTISITLKDSSVAITSGDVFGITATGGDATGYGALWLIQGSTIKYATYTVYAGGNQRYISVYRSNSNAFTSFINRFNIQIEEGTTSTEYVDPETGTEPFYYDVATANNIPTKVSDLNNDSGFITSSYHDSSKQDALVSGTSIKTVNNTSLLGSGNIDTNQLFVCTYGTTTFAEITTAINANKIPVLLNYSQRFLVLAKYQPGGYGAIFACLDQKNSYTITCAPNSTWSVSFNGAIEFESNKVTSISSSSTNTQYPSAKLLYDQLALKQDSLVFNTAYNSSTNKVATMSDLNNYISWNDLESIDSPITIYEDGDRVFDNTQIDLDTTYGAYGIKVYDNDNSKSVNLKFPYDKSAGTYTIATRDEIGLNVIDLR